MARWTVFPYDAAEYSGDTATLKTRWARLHQGDAEPFPEDAAVQAAWALFHAGRFQDAYEAGLAAGDAGIVVANKAQSIHANYLETREKIRLAMFMEVAERAEAQARARPGLANAHYWRAYALGRYSQGISVARALEQGLGGQVRAALETTLALAPRHADAHVALGAFHAEVIDQVGGQAGKAQGADAATGLQLFKAALALNPDSPRPRPADRRMRPSGWTWRWPGQRWRRADRPGRRCTRLAATPASPNHEHLERTIPAGRRRHQDAVRASRQHDAAQALRALQAGQRR
jgi:tetratricopeptide (TPR) repeat protein